MDVKERVLANLKSFGLDGEIKNTTLKHLMKVDEALEAMIQTQSRAINEIKSNKISINRVAKESGIARQTFYNNPIITSYVENYITTNADINPYETIESLREEIRHKNEQIEGLVQRDATVSQYKAQNKALTDEIASLQATIRSQDDLIRSLRQSTHN